MTEPTRRGVLSAAQTQQLLKGINPDRVLSLDGHSHVSQQDVTAHLIRVLGFGNFDTEVVSVELVYERGPYSRTKRGSNASYDAYDVCYRAISRVTIRNAHGEYVAHYEDGSTATAQAQPSQGDAHDLAYKSAISLSKKRAVISLGDQFGLSLYNRGQIDPLVGGTMVLGGGKVLGEEEARDMQAGVAPQVSLGNDEVEQPMTAEVAGPPRQSPKEQAKTIAEQPSHPQAEGRDDAEPEAMGGDFDYSAKVETAKDAGSLRLLWEGAREAGKLDQALKNAILQRKADLEEQAATAEAPAAEAKPATRSRAKKADTAAEAAPTEGE